MRAKLLARLLPGLLLALALGPPTALAQNQVAIVTDVSTHLGGCSVGPATVAVVYAPTATWSVYADLSSRLPPGVGVDALALLADGRIVFSTDAGFTSGGVTAADEDLVLLDRGALSLLLDGSAIGIRPDADLDAVAVLSVSPLDVYFSVDVPVEIRGTTYTDDDILELSRDEVSLAMAGSSLLGAEARRVDVDGLALDPSSGHFLVSTDVSIAGGGGVSRADDEDLLDYAGGGALGVLWDLSSWGVDGRRVDVRDFDLTAAVLFADSFESGGTSAWSSATP
jgi:hypothetical protein